MQRNNRSLDGKPIAAAVSGFSEYNTERKAVPAHPAPVFTPTDLRLQLKELKKLFANEAIDRAINLLFQHISAENPHQTDLTDFTTEIVDLLYKAYKENGGEGTREYYLQCLFRPLRVATLNDMLDPTKDDMVVSVRGLNRFLQQHEKDPEAHQSLLENLLPGQVVKDDPAYSVYSTYGVSYNVVVFDENINQENYDVTSIAQHPYSYIGPDGYLHYCQRVEHLPINYHNGIPEIPCFGERINTITESTNFEGLCTPFGVSFITNAEESPDGNVSATAVCTGDDTSDTRHYFSLPGITLPPNETWTFSLFAKPESCRYMAFLWQDLESSEITVQAVFDLKTGDHVCINPLTRYRCATQKLSGDYYRCEMSMTHPVGRTADLKVVFFKRRDNSPYYDFIGRSEICATVWGMQFEAGPCASPYIPTDGRCGLRKPLSVIVPLNEDWWDYKKLTLNLACTSPKQEKKLSRPLFTFGTETEALLTCKKTDNISIWQGTNRLSYAFDTPTDRYLQLTYSQDVATALLAIDGTTQMTQTPVDLRQATHLYLGCTPDGQYLEGYLHHSVLYSTVINAAQATFLNGEDLHG